MNTETISYDYGWLEDKEGKKFTPKTTTDQVKLKNGLSLTKKLELDDRHFEKIENDYLDRSGGEMTGELITQNITIEGNAKFGKTVDFQKNDIKNIHNLKMDGSLDMGGGEIKYVKKITANKIDASEYQIDGHDMFDTFSEDTLNLIESMLDLGYTIDLDTIGKYFSTLYIYTPANSTFKLRIYSSSTSAPCIIDWGDGSVSESSSSYSSSYAIYNHSYSKEGYYSIVVRYPTTYSCGFAYFENWNNKIIEKAYLDIAHLYDHNYSIFRDTSNNVLKEVNFINPSKAKNKSIPRYYLYNCNALEKVTIPEGITSILGTALNKSAIKTLILEPKTPPTLNCDIQTSSSLKIYVPKGCLNAYKTATNWAKYASYMVEMED